MLRRRTFLALSTAAAALVASGPRVWAQAGSDPTRFIVDLGNQLVAVVNGPGGLADKRQRMQPIIENAVDVDGIARFCLGRFWRVANPEQQAHYVQLFHQVLLNNITGKLGDFQGVSFTPTTTTQRDGETYVGTVIRRPNQEPNNVQWVVGTASGRLRVEDVVAEGTSLRLTQRSDYAAYLSRNGNNVDALLAAMRQQVGAGPA